MALRDIKIVFNERPEGIFCSGESVSGTITITLIKRKKFQDLICIMKGETKCKWKTKTKGSRTRSVYFRAEDEHFRESISLFAGTHYYHLEDGNVVLEPGNHSFFFQFNLSRLLPPSIEGTYGHCRYYVKVVADRPSRMTETFKMPFTVINTHDLNLRPSNRLTVDLEMYKEIKVLFSNRGTICMIIQLPQSGYVPGQYLQVQYTIKNNSKSSVTDVKLSLEKITKYVSRLPFSAEKVEKEKVVEYVAPGIEREKEIMSTISMVVPAVPPTTTVGSTITIEYYLQVKTTISGLHSNWKRLVPVIIGTVPLHADPELHRCDSQASSSRSFISRPSMDLQDLHKTIYQISPPPTYDESEMFQKRTPSSRLDPNFIYASNERNCI